jgi:penicillin-binding protein 2
MTDELTRLRRLRPDVPPVDDELRARALAVLQRTIDETVPASPSSAPSPPRRRRFRLNLQAALPVLASLAAVVIAVGAVVLLHHRSAQDSAASGPAAARGTILAASGTALVGSATVYDVRLDPSQVPAAERSAEYRRLTALLRLGPVGKCEFGTRHGERTEALNEIACQAAQNPHGTVTLEVVGLRDRQALAANPAAFPGVSVVPHQEVTYPQGTLAAQVLGTVGPITPEVLGVPGGVVTKKTIAHSRFKGLPLSALVGQSGLEYEYDRELRAGDSLRTTLQPSLERTGMRSLQHSIAANHGDGGAFVVMDPQNGQIEAMGSSPTYNPNVFTKPISEKTYQRLFGPTRNDPQLNRATQSAGAVGSVFKPFTGLAALESGTWQADESYDDTGQYCFAAKICLRNAGGAAYGVLDMVKALQVSDDVFFYNLGVLLNANPVTHPNGGALQQWAHRFGIGRRTGIDLPGEVPGTLPSPAVNKALYAQELQCENATGPYKGHPKHPASQGGCGIAANPDWTSADNDNTAVGQGDLQITPLQLAVAYGALANGGTIVTPHIGAAIQSPGGAVIQTIAPPPQRHLNLNPADLTTILNGLRDAASQPGGTSSDVMAAFPEQVYGKTGAAQYITGGVESEYGWYAAFVPATATSKPVVVVVTVEKGGFGDVAAAPVARQLLSQWFFGKPGPFKDGTSTDT